MKLGICLRPEPCYDIALYIYLFPKPMYSLMSRYYFVCSYVDHALSERSP